MLKPEDSDAIAVNIRTLQVIVGALTAGPIVFLVIALVLHARHDAAGGPAPGPALLPVVSVAAVVAAAVLIPLSLVVPRLVSDAARKQIAAGTWPPGQTAEAPPLGDRGPGDAARLAMVYLQKTIVGAALNEGAAFLAVIAYFLETTPYALALALVLIGGVALRFPRREGVEGWVEDQLGVVDALRHGWPAG
jgi:hypothetical protein